MTQKILQKYVIRFCIINHLNYATLDNSDKTGINLFMHIHEQLSSVRFARVFLTLTGGICASPVDKLSFSSPVLFKLSLVR